MIGFLGFLRRGSAFGGTEQGVRCQALLDEFARDRFERFGLLCELDLAFILVAEVPFAVEADGGEPGKGSP